MKDLRERDLKFIVVVLVVSIMAGCGTAPDQNALLYIENYSAEIVPATAAALLDLQPVADGTGNRSAVAGQAPGAR